MRLRFFPATLVMSGRGRGRGGESSNPPASNRYYSVRNGRSPGIYNSWYKKKRINDILCSEGGSVRPTLVDTPMPSLRNLIVALRPRDLWRINNRVAAVRIALPQEDINHEAITIILLHIRLVRVDPLVTHLSHQQVRHLTK